VTEPKLRYDGRGLLLIAVDASLLWTVVTTVCGDAVASRPLPLPHNVGRIALRVVRFRRVPPTVRSDIFCTAPLRFRPGTVVLPPPFPPRNVVPFISSGPCVPPSPPSLLGLPPTAAVWLCSHRPLRTDRYRRPAAMFCRRSPPCLARPSPPPLLALTSVALGPARTLSWSLVAPLQGPRSNSYCRWVFLLRLQGSSSRSYRGVYSDDRWRLYLVLIKI
jgi:hypothetical protein